MSAIIMNGQALQRKKFSEFIKKIKFLKSQKIFPHLLVIQVGNHLYSNIYITHKQRACEKLGIQFQKIQLPIDTSFSIIKKLILESNQNPQIHAILVQFPLPKHLQTDEVVKLINPKKDVDAIHPDNLKFKVKNTKSQLIPCTPHGIYELLQEYQISIANKKIVIFGESQIVGRPTAQLFRSHGGLVETFNTRTSLTKVKNLTMQADIIVLATGHKDVISKDMVKNNVVIIDVGIIREQGKIRGDIIYTSFLDKASYITPVPAGVGPMTITMLMHNIILIAEQTQKS